MSLDQCIARGRTARDPFANRVENKRKRTLGVESPVEGHSRRIFGITCLDRPHGHSPGSAELDFISTEDSGYAASGEAELTGKPESEDALSSSISRQLCSAG